MPIFSNKSIKNNYICYFTLYELLNKSFKKVTYYYEELKFNNNWLEMIPELLIVEPKEVINTKNRVTKSLKLLNEDDIILEKNSELYPERLKHLKNSPEFLFLRGNLEFVNEPIISIVGARKASKDGQNKAKLLAQILSEKEIVIASGLAKGIDINAHEGAIANNKPTIAVIGTPLNKYYPKEHKNMQDYIGKTGLIISQFPPGSPVQRWNFPIRNATMSGISIATIVMEASETSGSLIQARESLKQGRDVFIPQSVLKNPNLRWPKKYIEEKGAKKFNTVRDLCTDLENQGLLVYSASNSSLQNKCDRSD